MDSDSKLIMRLTNRIKELRVELDATEDKEERYKIMDLIQCYERNIEFLRTGEFPWGNSKEE